MSAALRLRFVREPRTIAALLAFLVTFALHAALIPSQGLTDDDDFYAPAAIRYAEWLGDALTSPGTAFTQKAQDAAFTLNHEHPPFAKLVDGVAHAVLGPPGLGVFGSLNAARAGTALFAALLSAVLVALLWRPWGPRAALLAPVLLLSLPRFLFHSEVATLDVPVAAMVALVTATFFWSEAQPTSTKRALACALAFGLALSTKLNAPFALLPCLAWALLVRRASSTSWRLSLDVRGAALELPPIPRAIAWMVVVGPLVFVAIWPWLWHDTFPRLGAYFAFHLNHYPIYLFYDGVIWERPFAPVHAVLALGFGAMPAPVVALGVIGCVRAGRDVVRLVRRADVDDAGRLRALLVLQAAFAMLIVMNPGVPRYGGEKLFMPFFPLFCALAADGALVVTDALRDVAARWRPLGERATLAAFAVVGALAVAPGVAGTVEHHGGYALSYYGELVGGLRGAVARGYERTYYDIADKPLAHQLDAMAKAAGGPLPVAFAPNHKEYVRTYRWLKRDGVISGKVTLDPDRRRARLVVLTHERRWSTYPALLRELEALEVVAEKRIDGVALWTVYRR